MSETDFEGEPQFTITPKEPKELEIRPKESSERKPLHTESISQIFTIREKRIPFTHQNTEANCGPLSITNAVKALEGVNDRFCRLKEFPVTSEGIRQLVSTTSSLRGTTFNTPRSEDIGQDNFVLQGEHISKLIKRLVNESNLEITGDRLSAGSGFRADEIPGIVRESDVLIHADVAGYHYTSFVRFDDTTWVHLDSINPSPVEVDQQTLEDRLRDVAEGESKKIAIFIAAKVIDGKVPVATPDEPIVTVRPKQETPPTLNITRKN